MSFNKTSTQLQYCTFQQRTALQCISVSLYTAVYMYIFIYC